MVTLDSRQVVALKIILERHIPVWDRMSQDPRTSAGTKFEASYFVDIANDLLQTISRKQAVVQEVKK